MTNISNTDLQKAILRCKKQDPIAQRKVYNHFILSLYNTANRILNDRLASEDAVQNAFIKAFAKIHQYDHGKGNFSSWLHRICVNESITILRKRKKLENLEDHTYIKDVESTALDHLEAEYILEAMKKLPETQRLIFTLYEVEGYAHKEIGTMLDITESSSRTYLMRAKNKLQTLLSPIINVKQVV